MTHFLAVDRRARRRKFSIQLFLLASIITMPMASIVRGATSPASGSPAQGGAAHGRAPSWPWAIKTFCREGPLLSHSEVPDEFAAKYADGVGVVSGVKKSNTVTIDGVERGWFGKAVAWSVPHASELNAQIHVVPKFDCRDEVVIYDTDQGYDPADKGRYHGKELCRYIAEQKPDPAEDVIVTFDAKSGRGDILIAGKSVSVNGPFPARPNQPVLLVFAVYGRNPGDQIDTTFTITQLAPGSLTAVQTPTAETTKTKPKTKTGTFMVDGPPVDPQMFAQVIARSGGDQSIINFKLPNNGADQKHPENYTLASHFAVYVPPGYQADGTWGVIVGIGTVDTTAVLDNWKAICDRRHFLIIAPQDTANEHYQPWRVSMALKGLQEMSRRYKFSAARTFLVGGSGGGRVSSITVILYPDLFAGAICYCGVDFVQVNGQPSGPNDVFSARAEAIQRAAANDRIYLYTGSKDGNLMEVRQAFDWYKKIGFRHVTYFEQEGAVHGELSDANFEKGLDWLDEPLAIDSAAKMKKGSAREGRSSWPGDFPLSVRGQCGARHGFCQLGAETNR